MLRDLSVQSQLDGEQRQAQQQQDDNSGTLIVGAEGGEDVIDADADGDVDGDVDGGEDEDADTAANTGTIMNQRYGAGSAEYDDSSNVNVSGAFPLRHGRKSHPKYEALYAALEGENTSERRLSQQQPPSRPLSRSSSRVDLAADAVEKTEAEATAAMSAVPILCHEVGNAGRASGNAPPPMHNIPLGGLMTPKDERPGPNLPRATSAPTSSTMRNRHEQQDPPARERPSEGQPWPKRDALSFTRSLVFYGEGSVTDEHEIACKYIEEARCLRQKYYGGGGTKILGGPDALSDSQSLEYGFGHKGVVEIYKSGDASTSSGKDRVNLVQVPQVDEFVSDYHRLVEVASDGAMRSYCFQRLQMLTSAFKTHVTANGHVENEAQSNLLGTDFYRTMKVDNHIHLAGAPTAKQFVSFVRDKLEKEADTVVLDDGQTLDEVFSNAGLFLEHLTIDAFNVLADYSVYQRFDNFNSKYSPFRMAQMRKIFLKVENHIEGRYFAELTKIVLARLEQSKGHNSAAEMRLSIYGMERHEWHNLAKWMLCDWKGGDYPGPVLSSHNRWMVQVPRLWRIYAGKKNCSDGKTRSFQDMLENLFCPLFEATLNPEAHPEVAELLKHIVGFDSVDDEGAAEVSDVVCFYV